MCSGWYGRGHIVPSFQMRNERQRKIKKLAQGHRADRWETWDLGGDLASESCLEGSCRLWSLVSLLLSSLRLTQTLAPLHQTVISGPSDHLHVAKSDSHLLLLRTLSALAFQDTVFSLVFFLLYIFSLFH